MEEKEKTLDELKEYRKQLSTLTEEEQKERDLYLKKLVDGTLQGPPTGKPSIDKQWLKYYSDEIILGNPNLSFSIAEGMSKSAIEYKDLDAIKYIKSHQSYPENNKKGDEVAKALIANGVKPGDYVTVCLPVVPEFGYFLYAINKVGAISNWLDFRTGEEELIDCMDKINSDVAITFKGVCGKVNNAIKKHNDKSKSKIEKVITVSPSDSVPFPISAFINAKEYIDDKLNKNENPIKNLEISYDKFLDTGKDIPDFDPVKFEKDSTAIIVYTGGTTGTPKGVELTNENLNAVVDGYKNSSIDFKKGDSFLHFLPPWTAYGIVIFYLSYRIGVKCIMIPKLDPSTYDKLILDEKPNHTTGIPKNLEILINSKLIKSNTNLDYFKTAAVGADSMNINAEKTTDDFLKEHNSEAKVVKGYGMTEGCATITTTSNSINKLGSVGIPFRNNVVSVFDVDTGLEMPVGEKGEICYTGPSVMKSYYENEKETNKVLRKHDDGKIWMHSGDIGYIDNDGFAYVVGRIKRMFVRSGFKLFSTVIEDAVSSHYAVKNCAAVGIPNELEGSIPVVSIVVKDEYKDKMTEEQIISEINNICNDKLFEYYMPLKYRITESIPYTKNGKVDFLQLINLSKNDVEELTIKTK